MSCNNQGLTSLIVPPPKTPGRSVPKRPHSFQGRPGDQTKPRRCKLLTLTRCAMDVLGLLAEGVAKIEKTRLCVGIACWPASLQGGPQLPRKIIAMMDTTSFSWLARGSNSSITSRWLRGRRFLREVSDCDIGAVRRVCPVHSDAASSRNRWTACFYLIRNAVKRPAAAVRQLHLCSCAADTVVAGRPLSMLH